MPGELSFKTMSTSISLSDADVVDIVANLTTAKYAAVAASTIIVYEHGEFCYMSSGAKLNINAYSDHF